MSKSAQFFRENFERLRAKSGVSQNKVGEDAGIASGNLSKLLKGKNDPNLETVENIARYFGVSVAEILSDPTKSQIQPRVVTPTPLNALEIVRLRLELAARFSPEFWDAVASATDDEIALSEKGAMTVLPKPNFAVEIG